MSRLDAAGFDTGGHRFDALAFTGKDQAGAIGAKRRHPISVTQDR